MAKKEKSKRFWLVSCLMCRTTVQLDIDDFRIVSTDQGAEFIRQPHFICGKCKSVCTSELIEEGEQQ